MEFTIVTSGTLSNFEEEVTKKLNEGWEFYGDLQVEDEIFFQPMTRSGEKKSNDTTITFAVMHFDRGYVNGFKDIINNKLNSHWELSGKTIRGEKEFFQPMVQKNNNPLAQIDEDRMY